MNKISAEFIQAILIFSGMLIGFGGLAVFGYLMQFNPDTYPFPSITFLEGYFGSLISICIMAICFGLAIRINNKKEKS